jgi:hypothetical protein
MFVYHQTTQSTITRLIIHTTTITTIITIPGTTTIMELVHDHCMWHPVIIA